MLNHLFFQVFSHFDALPTIFQGREPSYIKPLRSNRLLTLWSFAVTAFILGIVIIVTFVTLANTDILPQTENNSLPEPESAIITAENKEMKIPFPCTDHFPNGTEQWLLERDAANHFMLKVLFNNQEKTVFPVKATGVNQAAAKIDIWGNDWSVVSISLNNDQTSGWVTLQPSSVLPTSIQSISISDDSPAGVFWSPKSQKAVLDRVSSWLKTAKPFTGTIPISNDVSDIVHHNIGPSVLHVTGSNNFQTLIYPAWYVNTVGQKVDARSIENYIHYQRNVVVLIQDGTNFIYYFQSAPLYNWLKNKEWITEFNQNPAIIPLYRTNKNGQTYGSASVLRIYGNPQPDLIAARGTNGTSGYIKYEDFMGPRPKTPKEAIEWQKEGKFNKREIPLYAADGKTVIGSFK